MEGRQTEPEEELRRREIAEIMRDNIVYSGQVEGYVIAGAIEKIMEMMDRKEKEFIAAQVTAAKLGVKGSKIDIINGPNNEVVISSDIAIMVRCHQPNSSPYAHFSKIIAGTNITIIHSDN